MTEENLTAKAITTNAELMLRLLNVWMDDPSELVVGASSPGYWGEPTDDGVPIEDEPGNAVAFIAWSDLRDLFTALYEARGRAVYTVRDRYRDRIRTVEAAQVMTHEEMDQINEHEMWGPDGRPKLR